jgi:hypothetical protein
MYCPVDRGCKEELISLDDLENLLYGSKVTAMRCGGLHKSLLFVFLWQWLPVAGKVFSLFRNSVDSNFSEFIVSIICDQATLVTNKKALNIYLYLILKQGLFLVVFLVRRLRNRENYGKNRLPTR